MEGREVGLLLWVHGGAGGGGGEGGPAVPGGDRAVPCGHPQSGAWRRRVVGAGGDGERDDRRVVEDRGETQWVEAVGRERAGEGRVPVHKRADAAEVADGGRLEHVQLDARRAERRDRCVVAVIRGGEQSR